MKKCNCGKSVEADRYSYCYECWWALDVRTQPNIDFIIEDLAGEDFDPQDGPSTHDGPWSRDWAKTCSRQELENYFEQGRTLARYVRAMKGQGKL